MDGSTRRLIIHEARSILTRSSALRPFSEQMPMVPAASIYAAALRSIDRGLIRRRGRLQHQLGRFIEDAELGQGRDASPDQLQRRLVRLRLVFGRLLTEVDIFADVLTQRSEHHTGRLLAGLDWAAENMLHNGRDPFEAPPVVTYLDRGSGAAIRRAMSRLPAGGRSPVAVVRVPRERMVSTGLAGSVAHEVGHQAASQLGLVPVLVRACAAEATARPSSRRAWLHYARWSSEILADYWAVGRVGVAHTLGLYALMSLPTPHVFAGDIGRVHPIPWIRVLISAALGDAVAPDRQWSQLAAAWASLYPVERADREKQDLLRELAETLPDFVQLLVEQKPPILRGRDLGSLMRNPSMNPRALLTRARAMLADRDTLLETPPALAFAALGQARFRGAVSAADESRLLEALLLHWSSKKLRSEIARCKYK